MSEEEHKIEKARRLWDSAIEALQELRNVDEETLREIAKTRTRMPVVVFGQKGRIKSGITVAEYTKYLDLGSELPVKADLPNGGLKAYFLEYIDRVSMLKEGFEPERQISKYDIDEDGGWEQDSYDIQWAQDLSARKLPPLNHETLPQWADQITRDIIQDAQHYGDFDKENIGSKVQHFSNGYPREIEKLILKNYRKAIGRKIKNAPKIAAKRAKNSDSLPGMTEEWETFYKGKALSGTWIIDNEEPATREKVGEILLKILTDSP